MSRSWRPRLRRFLLFVVALPMLLAAGLGVTRITAEHEREDRALQASAAVDTAVVTGDLALAVGRLATAIDSYDALRSETGTPITRADAALLAEATPGVATPGVRRLGRDYLSAFVDDATHQLDTAAEHLDAQRPHLPADVAARLDDVFGRVTEGLPRARAALTGEAPGAPATIQFDVARDDLGEVLDVLLDGTDRRALALASVIDVMTTFSEEASLRSTATLTPGADVDAVRLGGVARRQDEHLANVSALAPQVAANAGLGPERASSPAYAGWIQFVREPGAPSPVARALVMFNLAGEVDAALVDARDALLTPLRDEAVASANKARGAVAVVTASVIGAIVIALTVALTVASWLERRIRELVDYAGRLAVGDLDAPAPGDHHDDEIGVLGQTLVSLAEALQLVESEAEAMVEQRPGEQSSQLTASGPVTAALARTLERVRETSRQLHDSEELHRLVVETASEAIVVVDERDLVLSANGAASRLFGLDVVGCPLDQLLVIDSSADGPGEAVVRVADGTTLPALVSTGSVLVASGFVRTYVVRDISDRKRIEEQLAHDATHDGLTGLPNRCLVHDHLTELLSTTTNGTVALLFVDLDHFKAVNDRLGHAGGDEVLIEVTRRLRSVVRPDDVVGRIGGDEFVVVLDAADDRARSVAERIVEIVALPYEVAGGPARIGASVGMSTARRGEVDTDQLMRQADEAMYEAKEAGRNQLRTFDATAAPRRDRRSSERAAFAGALSGGELELWLQPVVDVATDGWVGAEGLLRWRRDGRLSLPDEFLGVAERSGMAEELWSEVVGLGVAILDDLRDVPELVLTLNTRPAQLAPGRMSAIVFEHLGAAGVSPRRLGLELSERQGLPADPGTLDDLATLRGEGVSIVVDDHTVGDRSVLGLRRLGATAVKVDRASIAGVTREACEALGGLIDLASAFGIEVIPQGVEDVAQLDLVRRAGARTAQGWWWSKALPAPMFAAEIRRRAEQPPGRGDGGAPGAVLTST